jgi:hypothetical protein
MMPELDYLSSVLKRFCGGAEGVMNKLRTVSYFVLYDDVMNNLSQKGMIVDGKFPHVVEFEQADTVEGYHKYADILYKIYNSEHDFGKWTIDQIKKRKSGPRFQTTKTGTLRYIGPATYSDVVELTFENVQAATLARLVLE